MNNRLCAIDLTGLAEIIGFVPLLEKIGTPVRVSLPVSQGLWDKSIDVLQLSVRSKNGLKRYGLDTVGELAQQIMSENGIEQVRNLGRKSITEIKTKLLAAAYESLNDRDKTVFWEKVMAQKGADIYG